MYRTLNCGVGMVLCVPPSCEETALAELRESGEEAFVLGKVEPLKTGDSQVQLIGLPE
jgi:phosphoribosylformylglycinamidine cyclo-ligase